jgi:FkbM family methyltransferase
MSVLLSLFDRVPRSWIRAAGTMRGRSARIKKMTDWLPAMLRNREGRIQKGLGRGLRFNGAHSAVGFVLGTHDLDVQYALSRLLVPGMTVFDIGANVGFTAVLAAKCVAPTGRVVCFEPLPENAVQIQHNAGLNGFSFVDVHELALAREDGESAFFVSEASTWGRLAQSGPAPKQSGVIRVPVRSLDSMFDRGEIPKPDLIKMDVEGGEVDVLQGARRMLAATRPVLVVELHHTYQGVADALAGLEYSLRPLTVQPEGIELQGEFQLLAYPNERGDAESVCRDLAAGKMVFE